MSARKSATAWLALFAADAVVQDPVGQSPLDPVGEGHRGHDAIGRFWDTVIAPVKSRCACASRTRAATSARTS
jgi:hypothetical protein